MNLIELMRERQSCRNFSSVPIEREKIEACIEAASLAPSACNSQPWKYVVVTKLDYLPSMAKAVQTDGINRFADQCQAFVVVLEQPAMLISNIPGKKVQNQKYASLDIGLSVMQLCLQAQELGIGSCIMGSFDADALVDLLDLPKADRQIRLVIGLGYPKDSKIRKKVRKPSEQLVSYID